MVEQDIREVLIQTVYMETAVKPDFLEKNLKGNESPRCVDGRPAEDSEQGPQMLGGTLHPVVISAIFNDFELNSNTVASEIKRLQSVGFKTGVHRGSHKHEGVSDCGFADRLKDILAVAQKRRGTIHQRLMQIYETNRDQFRGINLPPVEGLINNAFEEIESLSTDKIKIVGEDLVKCAQDLGSTVETVEGDHTESIAFVNLRKNTTLDTIALNQQGKQAFNLDLLTAIEQAKQLGVPENLSILISLILYLATEKVLVEDKGKPALNVEIHV